MRQLGALAGVPVVCSVLFFDMIKADDPVGAVSVHGAGAYPDCRGASLGSSYDPRPGKVSEKPIPAAGEVGPPVEQV